MASCSSSSSGGGSSSSPSSSASGYLFGLVWLGAAAYASYFFLEQAYRIRLQAIDEFGPVIHEFDPYFNYRATEYLYEHGAKKFLTWFDYKVWYPLGRPVGSTIYPGMQFTAVFLKNHIVGDRMSLNDVCCYMPAWFGALASLLIGLLAYECSLPQNSNMTLFGVLVDAMKGRYTDDKTAASRSSGGSAGRRIFGLSSPAVECGVFACGIMAVVPAHIMRSVGGGYDNESVAVSAMSLTYLLWIRSLRSGDDKSWIYGLLGGVAYFYMVAAWGGYVFVLNLVGVHALALVLVGRFGRKVYLSYSLFYAVGTALAVQVPVVGWAPLKSIEQLGPCVVFLGYQVLYLCEVIRKKRRLSRADAWKLRIRVGLIAAIAGIVLVMLFVPSGYFGPISSRVRGLFVKHTKTGNPLVDSVAEHQPASSQAYFQYLHHLCTLAPIGFLIVVFQFGDGPSFLLVYGVTAYFFSHKMVRLILLTGPIASALGGIAVGRIFAWAIGQLWGGGDEGETAGEGGGGKKVPKATPADEKGGKADGKKSKKSKKGGGGGGGGSSSSSGDTFAGLTAVKDGFVKASNSQEGIITKRTLALISLGFMYVFGLRFKDYCWRLSKGLSNPTIILKGQLRNGETVYVDDYREAYWWIRDHTPEDSRIMAWWDYGYQITAISNRTTIADGNTWNHEHIGLLGKILTGPVDESYEIARHMADYILVWGGGGGDDLAKVYLASNAPVLCNIPHLVFIFIASLLFRRTEPSSCEDCQQCLQGSLPGRSDVPRLRHDGPLWDSLPHDEGIPPLQPPRPSDQVGRRGRPHQIRGSLPFQIRQGPRLQDPRSLHGIQKLGRRPGQPSLRRSRKLVLPRAVSPRPTGRTQYEDGFRSIGGFQQERIRRRVSEAVL
uniref:dolichyl-diphosphooligosaccharide--protein glycotransferase n=1 Tax=Odontella aurita TaxID=265563 RepID=A0A7S4ID25_9STRA